MIKHYPYQQLGQAEHGWLKSRHHFSFAHYYHPQRMGFGSLRVINDDWVAPGTGFDTHPHRNMEIISFVRSGSITHKDSQGNQAITSAGEVQVMSAGTGISHSEYNLSAEPLIFYQIWIQPSQQNVNPSWDSKPFGQQAINGQLPLLVSGYPQDEGKALFIHQQARIYGGKVRQGEQLFQSIEHQVYILASQGSVELVDGQHRVAMNKGDGAEVTGLGSISIHALSDAEILVIDAPQSIIK